MRRMQCLESFIAGICGIRNTEAEYRSWYSRLLPENQRTLSARVWRRHYTERFHLTVLPDWNVFAACAFAHFLQYGMKLTERVEYEFKPMDMGNVMHEALESFAEEVRKRGMKWTELTEQERNEIADRCLDNIVADYGNTVLKSSARNEYMIERTRRILRRTVWALQKQLEQGEFQPEGFEVTSGEDGLTE